jgi:hypothetical protein
VDEKTLARFMDKVHMEPMSGCWLWVGAMRGPSLDRPVLRVRGEDGSWKMGGAFREAYKHFIGQITD